MPAPRVTHANELKAAIEAALAVAELPDAIVSLDPLDIPSGARHGIVLIPPPDLEFPTYAITEITHELFVVAGPPTNIPAAWATLDAILEAIRRSPLTMTAARADMFAVQNGPALPGYVLTLDPDTVIDESETP